MWYQAGHYSFLIRFKVSLNYLDKLPKNLQYGEREKFSIYSRRNSGIPIRYSSDPGNISPISSSYSLLLSFCRGHSGFDIRLDILFDFAIFGE